MPKLPGVNHLRAVKALQKPGFQIERQSKHIFMSKGAVKIVVPRNSPVDAYTMAAIVRDAGWSIEDFKELLYEPFWVRHISIPRQIFGRISQPAQRAFLFPNDLLPEKFGIGRENQFQSGGMDKPVLPRHFLVQLPRRPTGVSGEETEFDGRGKGLAQFRQCFDGVAEI
jgi:predicted RNA binding protein YcfA (HicA-like mRNA interferase family)